MRRFALFMFVVTLPFVSAGEAEAKPKASPHPVVDINEAQLPALKPIITDYDVYVGGVHLLEAQFGFHEQDAKYHVDAHVKTHGFWHRIFPWKAELYSDGIINGDRFAPQIHKNTSFWDDDSKTVKIRYDDQKNATAEFVPDEKPDDNREIVTPEQRRGSLDPLSVILQLLGDLAVNNSCAATEPAFDGKRRFNLISENKGWSINDPQGLGVYKGKTRRCDIYFKMISGRWLDREHSLFWQYMDGEKGHEPFRIWLARLSPELPEFAVRVESPSVWGRIVIHLRDWRYAKLADYRETN